MKKRKMYQRLVYGSGIGLFFSSLDMSYGCTACFSAPNSIVSIAIGNAILFLLGVVGMVLLSVVGFIGCLAYRAKKAKIQATGLEQKEMSHA
ncbi:MAG: hypothetical protein K1X66_00220 [Verrucomicrobiae bacterium]|nr:hypothetical protein [Verrucomicrobiae bacterium]